MKFLSVFAVFLASVQAFTTVPPSTKVCNSAGSSFELGVGSKRAQEQLEAKEKDLDRLWRAVKDVGEKKDSAFSAELAEKILETSLEKTKTVQMVEEQRVKAALIALEKLQAEKKQVLAIQDYVSMRLSELEKEEILAKEEQVKAKIAFNKMEQRGQEVQETLETLKKVEESKKI